MANRTIVKKFSVNMIPKEFELLGMIFQACAELDYRTFDEIFKSVEAESEESASAQIINQICDMLLNDDERDSFRKVIEDPDTAIPVTVLMDIQKWLLEEYGVIKRDNKSRN